MVTRRVAFYRLDDAENRPEFDLEEAVGPINDLPQDRWEWTTPSYRMGLLVDQTPTVRRPAHVRLLRLRDDMPRVMDPSRRVRVLGMQAGDTLTELTHAVIWPDHYLAAASSRDAPSITRLSAYLDGVCGQACIPRQLYDPSTVARFKAMRPGLKTAKMKVRIRSSEAQQALEDEKLKGFRSFFVAGEEAEAVTMTVEFSIDRARNDRLDASLHQTIERLARYDKFVDSLVVGGDDQDGRPEKIDLKNQRITREIQFADNATDGAIYRLLEAARREVEDELGGLDNAAGLE